MNGDYRLRRLDEYNWVVDQRVVAKKKNSKGKAWRTVGYFPSLDRAAQRLLDRILLTGEDEPSVKSLIRDVRDARAYVAASVLTQLSASRIDADPERVGRVCLAENKPKLSLETAKSNYRFTALKKGRN